MKGLKTVYICEECSYRSPKWMGKCPSCGAWNTFIEDVIDTAGTEASAAAKRNSALAMSGDHHAVRFDELALPTHIRYNTGLDELDRVLGGGLVLGEVVLLSGEPGIGKSTLLLQISQALGQNRKVLYVSGEESGGQLKLRADRLGVNCDNLYVLTETNIDSILRETDKLSPEILIVDSIQTVWSEKISSAPGSIAQVRENAMAFIGKAKGQGVSVFLVGHVNKEGSIAGPKILEHMVDAVLCFEGEKQQSYRIIRATKNRYGSTNEIGVFEMTDKGLEEVTNPSEMLLSGRPKGVSGSAAVCTVQGTRPLIAEVQALVSQTYFPSPRRVANSIDYNRLCLIIDVLEKRMGLKFYQNDVYTNVVGGLRLDETATDLSVALALLSSLLDRVVPEGMIAVGEIGLSGEVRAVSHVENRVKEAARLGFTTAVIPYRNVEKRPFDCPGIKIHAIRSIFELPSLLVTMSEDDQHF